MFIQAASYQSGVLCLFLWCVLAFCVRGPGRELRVWSRQSEIMLCIHVMFFTVSLRSVFEGEGNNFRHW